MLSLDVCLTVAVNFHVEGHRVAADGAVFDVFLTSSLSRIDRDNDLLTAGGTGVTCFVEHWDGLETSVQGQG